MAANVRDGDFCPTGCGNPVVLCECDPEAEPDGHLICLGCGQDADEAEFPCDCPPILTLPDLLAWAERSALV